MADHDVRRAHGFRPLRVKRVVEETHDTRSFVLDVPDHLRDVFHYRAGQFCTFRVRLGDDELMRCYSMSSAPEIDDDLAVTVKRVPGGLVSNWFNDVVSEGDVLDVTKPAGVFCVREGDRPVVAFCGGSGVTPVMSIAKSVLATTDRRVRLLYANRDRGSVIFGDDLARLQSAYGDRLRVQHHFDCDGGFLDAASVAAFAAPAPDADVYICGPGAFMDLVESTLHDAGVTLDRIFIERFVAAANPAVEVPPTDGAGSADVPECLTLILKGKPHTVAYHPGDTVLQTARRAGLPAPFSCEAGECATCMAMLRDGTVKMRVNNALSADEVDEGWILTCQSLPTASTVTVEYESF